MLKQTHGEQPRGSSGTSICSMAGTEWIECTNKLARARGIKFRRRRTRERDARVSVQGNRAMLASPRWAVESVGSPGDPRTMATMAQPFTVLLHRGRWLAGAPVSETAACNHRQLARHLLSLAHTASGNAPTGSASHRRTATWPADPPFILARRSVCAPSRVRHSCLPLLRGGPITARLVDLFSWRRLAPQPNQDPLLEKARHRSSFARGPALRSLQTALKSCSRRSPESRAISCRQAGVSRCIRAFYSAYYTANSRAHTHAARQYALAVQEAFRRLHSACIVFRVRSPKARHRERPRPAAPAWTNGTLSTLCH
jgi:hypothetical protein